MGTTMVRCAGALILVCLVVTSGCGISDAPPPLLEAQYTSMKPLGLLYGNYLSRFRRPPKSEEDFRKFLTTVGADAVRAARVTDVEILFRSPRSNEPLVILYGKPGPPGPAGQPWVAYEKTPMSGVRYVASTVGAVAEMDEERFRSLFPNAE